MFVLLFKIKLFGSTFLLWVDFFAGFTFTFGILFKEFFWFCSLLFIWVNCFDTNFLLYSINFSLFNNNCSKFFLSNIFSIFLPFILLLIPINFSACFLLIIFPVIIFSVNLSNLIFSFCFCDLIKFSFFSLKLFSFK